MYRINFNIVTKLFTRIHLSAEGVYEPCSMQRGLNAFAESMYVFQPVKCIRLTKPGLNFNVFKPFPHKDRGPFEAPGKQAF